MRKIVFILTSIWGLAFGLACPHGTAALDGRADHNIIPAHMRRVELPLAFPFVPTIPMDFYLAADGLSAKASLCESDLMIASNATYYISAAGSGGAGTNWTTAFTNFQQAVDSITATSPTIYVADGVYPEFVHTNSARTINYIATNRAVITPKLAAGPWTATNGFFVAQSKGSPWHVVDVAATNSHGIAQMKNASSLSNCAAKAGTYWIAGSNVFVHTFDGRAPDASVIVNSEAWPAVLGWNSYYFENITFAGGKGVCTDNNGVKQGPTTVSLCRHGFSNCSFIQARQGDAVVNGGNGLNYKGLWEVYLLDCMAAGNELDGFNYHLGGSTESPRVVEVNCRGVNNGWMGFGSNQGSTTHDNCAGIRVGGYYANNGKQDIADANNAYSCNIGVHTDGLISFSGYPYVTAFNLGGKYGRIATTATNFVYWLESNTNALASHGRAYSAPAKISAHGLIYYARFTSEAALGFRAVAPVNYGGVFTGDYVTLTGTNHVDLGVMPYTTAVTIAVEFRALTNGAIQLLGEIDKKNHSSELGVGLSSRGSDAVFNFYVHGTNSAGTLNSRCVQNGAWKTLVVRYQPGTVASDTSVIDVSKAEGSWQGDISPTNTFCLGKVGGGYDANADYRRVAVWSEYLSDDAVRALIARWEHGANAIFGVE